MSVVHVPDHFVVKHIYSIGVTDRTPG